MKRTHSGISTWFTLLALPLLPFAVNACNSPSTVSQSTHVLEATPGTLAASNLSATATVNPPISVTSTSYIDEIVDSPEEFQPRDRVQLLEALSGGDLISMGESHERGSERTYLTQLYVDLALFLDQKPDHCLVENYDMLLATDDPVRAAFNQICANDIVYNNKAGWVYTSLLDADLKQGTVLTHTGYRHMLPIALMYPHDFATPQWVDLPPHGTITKQIPDYFLQEGKKMRSHSVRAMDDLMTEKVMREIIQGASPAAEAARVQHWLLSNAFSFKSGENSHIFEVMRVNQSFKFEHSYLSVLNHPVFQAELLVKLLQSSQFAELLTQVDLNQLTLGAFLPDTANSLFEAGSVALSEPGTIYAYAPQKDGKKLTVVVWITPTQDTQTKISTL